MTRIVPDCSFLSHAFVPQQHTASAVAAFDAANRTGHEFLAPSVVLVEFLSLLRKLRTRRSLGPELTREILEYVMSLLTRRAEPSDAALARAWSIATRLGQSDVFDALGYAVAEEIGAEFWTSDLRFHNAAVREGLSGMRFIG